MVVVNAFTSELNHFVDTCSKGNLSKIALSTARVAAFMATAGFFILATISIFAGNAPGFFGNALIALAAHEIYHVVKNADQGKTNYFHGTIVLEPIANFVDRVLLKK